MRSPQFMFFRGSSPTLELMLPLVPASGDRLFVTFSQEDSPVLELAKNANASPQGEGRLILSQDEPGLVLVNLAQQDTLRMKTGACRLQVRIGTDAGTDTFFPLDGYVGEALKEGVI